MSNDYTILSKYVELDAAIMRKMGGHPQALSAVFVRDVREICEKIAADESTEKRRVIEPVRVCDRRMQALRKSGQIRHNGKGWLRAQPQATDI